MAEMKRDDYASVVALQEGESEVAMIRLAKVGEEGGLDRFRVRCTFSHPVNIDAATPLQALVLACRNLIAVSVGSEKSETQFLGMTAEGKFVKGRLVPDGSIEEEK